MSIKQMSDNAFEALFKQAVIDDFFDELDSLPPAHELSMQYKPSDAHTARMKRLFATEKRRDRGHVVLMWSKRIAAVITIAVTLLFGSLMFVSEVRAAVVDTIIEWRDRFVRFTSTSPDVEKTNLEPLYIPDGFNEEIRDDTGTVTIIMYINADNEIITFQSSLSGGSLSVDSEERTYEAISINGVEYHMFVADYDNDENTVLWDNLGQRYFVTSTISMDELMKMALSVS